MDTTEIENRNEILYKQYHTIDSRQLLSNHLTIDIEEELLFKAMRRAGIEEKYIRKTKYQDFFKCLVANAKANTKDVQWMTFSKHAEYYSCPDFPDFFTRTVVINSMEAMLAAKTFVTPDNFEIGLRKKQNEKIGTLFLFTPNAYVFANSFKNKKKFETPKDLYDFYTKDGDYVGNVRGWNDSSGRHRHQLSNLRKTIRKELDWDGQPTTEVDITGCFITMLYDFNKIPRPFVSDPYTINNGLSRDTNKFLVNNLIFCGVTPKYFSSIRNQINKDVITDIPDSSNRTIQAYLDSVLEVHGSLVEYFNQDNRFLFELEGKITSKVFDGFVTANKKIFTTFDGCIVQTENKEFAKSLLSNYWKEVLECEHEPIIKEKQTQDNTSSNTIVPIKPKQPALLPTTLHSEISDDASRADQLVELMLKAETDELNKEETRKKDLLALKAIKNRLFKAPSSPVKPIKEDEPLDIPTDSLPVTEELVEAIPKEEIHDALENYDWDV